MLDDVFPPAFSVVKPCGLGEPLQRVALDPPAGEKSRRRSRVFGFVTVRVSVANVITRGIYIVVTRNLPRRLVRRLLLGDRFELVEERASADWRRSPTDATAANP